MLHKSGSLWSTFKNQIAPGAPLSQYEKRKDGLDKTAEDFRVAGLWRFEALDEREPMTASVNGVERMSMGGGNDDDEGTGAGTVADVRAKPKRPSMYRVLILNDDYTPMDFVVHVLERFFNKGREEATQIMLHVHHHGVGECGVFTYEVAETKVTQVMDFARRHQHPLQCVMEKK